MTYNDYLKSDNWKQISSKRKEIDGYKCCCCGSDVKLAAHHISYPQNWFETKTDDLRTLCSDCHLIVHRLQEYYDGHEQIFNKCRIDGVLHIYPELKLKLKTQTARYLAVECWRKNIFSQAGVKQFANAIMKIVNNAEWCGNSADTHMVMEYLATAKDCLIANDKPTFDKYRRKYARQSKSRYK